MKLRPNKSLIFLAVISLLGLLIFVYFSHRRFVTPVSPVIIPTPTSTPSITPTSTPTPKPLTFTEMNALYGPCVNLPVLMYHHIQESETAKTNGNSGLTVNPENFEKHLAYLNDRGYISITPAQLISFFDSGVSLPKKSVMLTFDDGYDDLAIFAAPLLSRYNVKSSVFLPTGLLENPGYLTWNTISSLASQGIYFGNHTWSHKNMGTSLETIKSEITTAATQLSDHGLDPLKVFVYPYGTISQRAIGFLRESGYQLAFTTVPGRIACAKQRLTIPRLRIGNPPLSNYGL